MTREHKIFDMIAEAKSCMRIHVEVYGYVYPLTVWGGGKTISIDDQQQADAFNADPEKYTAQQLGFSTADEYYEWLLCYGAPLCSNLSCSHRAGLSQCDVEEWKALHRSKLCKRCERRQKRKTA